MNMDGQSEEILFLSIITKLLCSAGEMIFRMILLPEWIGQSNHLRKLTILLFLLLGHPDQITVKSGEVFVLDASGTTDPDE